MEDAPSGLFDDGSIAGSFSRELSSVRGTFSTILFCRKVERRIGLSGGARSNLLGSGITGLFLGSGQACLKPLLVFRFLLFSGDFLPLELVFDEGRLYPRCHVVDAEKISMRVIKYAP